jgi:Ser/Thr protein kinase RdoA (MazF antagonist)
MISPLHEISQHFSFRGTIEEIRPVGEGLINDTYLVETRGDDPNYILQRKNRHIFTNVPAMMENIQKVTNHLKKKVEANGGDPLREALTVVPAADGKLYYRDAGGEYWAACLFIEDTVSHDKAGSPELARQGGKGIGRFQALLSDMTEPLVDTLPGFHDIRYRFRQWDETLAADPAGRKKEVPEEIAWIESRRDEMLAFRGKVERGEIPTRVTHNDTKISNILFDRAGGILCVIDLDTVLSGTCLNDYGDAIRSYANTGLEDDRELDRVSLDIDIFRGYTEGYLSEAIAFLTPAERENLAFSARYITFEQVLRFLMDYINGDTYYKTKYPEHNLTRARAQYKLLRCMEERHAEMHAIVEGIAREQRSLNYSITI